MVLIFLGCVQIDADARVRERHLQYQLRVPPQDAAQPLVAVGRGSVVHEAAGHQHRVYDAVVLKTLGATRARLVGAYGLEYAGLGLATAVFAIGAGTIAAYGVVTQVMNIGFAFSPLAAFGAVVLALAFTLGFGLLGTWRALSVPPVRVLRHL